MLVARTNARLLPLKSVKSYKSYWLSPDLSLVVTAVAAMFALTSGSTCTEKSLLINGELVWLLITLMLPVKSCATPFAWSLVLRANV